MTRMLSNALILILCVTPSLAGRGDALPPPQPPTPVPAKVASQSATAPSMDKSAIKPGPASQSAVVLPADFTVGYDEGFVTLTAVAAGNVEWLVLTNAEKMKFKKDKVNKSIDISVPPKACTITVFCWSSVNNDPTAATRCVVTVTGPVAPAPAPPPNPTPTPTPTPAVVKGDLVITVIEDPTHRDPANTLITGWLDTQKKLVEAGYKPYLKSINDLAIKKWLNAATAQNPDFQAAVRSAGVPLVIAQDPKTGKVVGIASCPKTEAELFEILSGEK